MPAIAGVCGSDFGAPETILRSMMSALSRLGVSGSRTSQLDGRHFGIQRYNTLPEDEFDCQPYVFGRDRYILLADARVDNRDELAADLGVQPSQLHGTSDAELLALGWECWGLGLTDRLLGDIALAVWDNAERELSLVRGPLSSRPIFFACHDNSIVFASLPAAILATGSVSAAPNLDEFARLLGGGLYLTSGSSFFAGIGQVRQGRAAVVRDGEVSEHRLWNPGRDRLQISVAEAGARLRDQLDRVVRAQTRRQSGPVAHMLSSGRDSSAVVASAARIEGLELLAVTSAPRRSVEGLPAPWIGDESAIARETAARAGVRHLTCRSENTNLASLLDEVSAVDFQPYNNPANLPWIRQLCVAARKEGAEAMIGGFAGNLTISLGGPAFLADYVREKGLAGWFDIARNVKNTGSLSWPQILSRSLSWMAGPKCHRWLRLLGGRPAGAGLSLPLLREPFRSRAEAYRRERFGDLRAKPSARCYNANLIQLIEPGNKYAQACWGVDLRDPTADRRLAELCLSLPVEAYVGGAHSRPAYHSAFKDSLAEDVLEGRHIGAQSADWFEAIGAQDVLAGFRRYFANPIVAEIFDADAIDQLIERWPSSASTADAVHDEYCNQLLGGLAVASFINAHFPG